MIDEERLETQGGDMPPCFYYPSSIVQPPFLSDRTNIALLGILGSIFKNSVCRFVPAAVESYPLEQNVFSHGHHLRQPFLKAVVFA